MNIRNPRTGQYDYTIPDYTTDEVAHLCTTLKQHNTNWAATTITQRIAALQAWKQAILQHKQALLHAVTADTGRIKESILEVDLIATSIDRWCGIAKDFFGPIEQLKTSIPYIQLQQAIVPYALVGVISPWNFPILLALIDTIPALLAGCSVLVKPSEITPRCVVPLQATINEVPLLSQACTIIQGGGSVGAAMVQHCDIICFTGSTATGNKVYQAASQRLIPVFLELGGKDPAIVLNNANLDLATSSILWGSTVNAGQSCLSIERVYVQQGIYHAFVQMIVHKAKQINVNSTNIHEGDVGPIIFEKQAHIINAQLQDALSKGAVLEYGNAQCTLIQGGYYCLPTILTHVNHTMLIMQQETFGPIIPIIPYNTIPQAIQLANDSIYGLSAAVFAASTQEAMAVAQHIIAGAVSINDCALTAIMHEGEKNSFKQSGIGGTRMGPNAIKRFMKQKVYIVKDQAIPSPWWYQPL